MSEQTVVCEYCQKELPESVFTVSWGDFCGADCATNARHVQLGEA